MIIAITNHKDCNHFPRIIVLHPYYQSSYHLSMGLKDHH
jgi:hypothetical protein